MYNATVNDSMCGVDTPFSQLFCLRGGSAVSAYTSFFDEGKRFLIHEHVYVNLNGQLTDGKSSIFLLERVPNITTLHMRPTVISHGQFLLQ